jgi:cyanate lyase
MTTADITKIILEAKGRLGLTWDTLAERLDVPTSSLMCACLGRCGLPAPAAWALCEYLELPEEVARDLSGRPEERFESAIGSRRLRQPDTASWV